MKGSFVLDNVGGPYIIVRKRNNLLHYAERRVKGLKLWAIPSAPPFYYDLGVRSVPRVSE
jgi:hypothetical protein